MSRIMDRIRDLRQKPCSLCEEYRIYQDNLCLRCYGTFLGGCTNIRESPITGDMCHIVGWPVLRGNYVFVKVHDITTNDIYGVELDKFISSKFSRLVTYDDIAPIRGGIDIDFEDAILEVLVS